MPGKILIVDGVATNRIVLKVKMASAQYDVRTCSDCREAEDMMAEVVPDLILVNLSEQTEDRHAFCRRTRGNPATRSIALVGIGIADTTRNRFAALDSGVDDVLPHPISDVLMLARIRSLMRRRQVGFEWQLRDGTRSALGFDEDAAPRLAPPRITVLSDDAKAGGSIVDRLRHGCKRAATQLNPGTAMAYAQAISPPDIFVINGQDREGGTARLFQLIADLNSRQETMHTAKLVMIAPDQPEVAAMLLDLDVEDVIPSNLSDAELALRIDNIAARKTQKDSMRDRVRAGLMAAVTDPLTGLHNRRYADTELQRLAENSGADGQQFALMLVDIDHFKSINDTHGHAIGDAVLIELAARLKRNFRGIDILARIGGEEFLIAMPKTNAFEAELAAERLRRQIGARPCVVGAEHTKVPVTISVGIALSGLAAGQRPLLDEMFSQADAALYAAKSAGRNAVSMACAAA